ncbi:MAG TPA: RnfABCDGE type electron transport complex subunit G [Candidatus Rifleibacterium sp.]|nr:RnfABCDGE type electron transport complex subunit G [Candidatus Rifleibacterium sp.]HPT48300.1 RnfABCDGE type electron transport complex subunit G [Candidatus Rifleibacterium sp.]
MKDMLHMGLFLFVIAAIAGVLLAFTESFTAPYILENQKKLEEQARREVLPTAATFKEGSFIDTSASQTLSFSSGFLPSGELAGIVVKVSPKGFAGPIEMMLGITGNGRVNGFKILSLKETPGLGSKLTTAAFAEPFKKLISEVSDPIFKVKKDNGNVDAITAATISSRAFCSGVRQALDIFHKVQPQLPTTAQPPLITAPGSETTVVSPAAAGGNK